MEFSIPIKFSIFTAALDNWLWCSAITNPRAIVPAGLYFGGSPPRFLMQFSKADTFPVP